LGSARERCGNQERMRLGAPRRSSAFGGNCCTPAFASPAKRSAAYFFSTLGT
jgi:hypothetical protein